MQYHLSIRELEGIEDPQTDERLLPLFLRKNSNSRRVKHCRIATRKAINNCLSAQQRERLELYYGQGLSKSEIARLQGSSCSAITKSLAKAEALIKHYVQLYLDIYDTLEQEFQQDGE